MTSLIATAFATGCALCVALIAYFVRRASKHPYEPMEYSEPPARTKIWSDHVSQGEQE